MKKEKKNLAKPVSLRQKAERLLKKKNSEGSKLPDTRISKQIRNESNEQNRSEAEMLKLLHELEIHQIELEIQNKELKLERDKAEKSAIQYAELFEEIYEFSPAGYLTITPDGTITSLNLNGAKLLGKERSVLINSNLKFFIHQNTLNIFNNFVQNVFETRTLQSCQVEMVTKKNISIIVQIEGVVAKDENKCLLAMMDITGQMRIEHELKKHNQDLNSIFETMAEALTFNEIVYDNKGEIVDYRILKVNKAFYSIGDYKGTKVIGNLATKLFGISAIEIKSLLNEHKNQKETVSQEYCSPLHSKYLYVSVSPIIDNKFVTTFFDISEHKRIEQKLKLSEEKFSKAFSLNPAAICINDINDNNRFIDCNASFERISGYSRSEIIGSNSDKIKLFADPAVRDTLIREIKETGKICNVEFLFRKKNGEIRQGLVSGEIIEIDNKKLSIATIQDITNYKMMEEELNKIKKSKD